MPDLERQQYLAQIEQMSTLVDKLTATITAQTATIASQADTIAEMSAKIDALQQTIKELTERVNKNSRNSSKPPSSDGYQKPNPKSLREKSGKKQGGQKGHPGNHMALPHEPDEVKQHYPEKCLRCPHLAECVTNGTISACGESRYVVDVVVTTRVTKHEVMQPGICPLGETGLCGKFPDGIKAYIQYGDSVTVLAGLLSTYGAVALNRIHVLLGSLMGVKLSAGTISAMVHKCAKKVGPVMEVVQKLLQKAYIGCFDETGVRACGKLLWVHNSSNERFTFQTISRKRGKPGIDENGVLPEFNGIAIHDCWSPYWKYKGIRHAICNAHLLRELTGIAENNPDHQWPILFKTLLRSMKKAKEKAIRRGKTKLQGYFLYEFGKEYDRIMKIAKAECPDPSVNMPKKRGRKKKGKERALIERLMLFKDAVCLFIHDFKVPFDNNQAERDLRAVKAKKSVSGCFRSKRGAQDYLDVMSYLSTGKKHNISVFDALTAAFAGNAEIILQ